MTAADVLKRMADAYATARSYADTGVLESVTLKRDQRRVRTQAFSTAFERPRWFRFQYDDEHLGPTWIRCRNEDLATLHFGKRGDETLALGRAIAGLTGVSGGVAHRVPRLLPLQGVHGRSTADLDAPTLEGEEEIQGFRCHRLTGRFGGQAETLWIDTECFLLRRIFDRKRFGKEQHERFLEELRRRGHQRLPTFEDFTGETTTTYHPVKDGPIHRGVFDAG